VEAPKHLSAATAAITNPTYKPPLLPALAKATAPGGYSESAREQAANRREQ